MAEQQGATLKNRLEELISNINSCTTVAGVGEMEDLYTKKKKELGENITPMMDIRVRDAIAGRRGELERYEEEAAEAAKEKKAAEEQKKLDADSSKIAATLDEHGVWHSKYEDFWKRKVNINETSIDTAVVTFARMNPPTKAHAMIGSHIQEIADATGGHGIVFLSQTQDPKRNPLTVEQKVEFVDKMMPERVEINTTQINLFSMVESLANRGFTTIYALVGADRIDEFARCGKYFLAKGGQSFEVVSTGEREGTGMRGVSSTAMREAIDEDSWEMFEELTSLERADAELLYDTLSEQMGYL